MPSRYPFVVVEVQAGRADEIGAALFELGAAGVEERDDVTLARGPGAGLVTLVASFPDREAADAAVSELLDLEEGLAPRVEEIEGDAWRDAWKEFYAPFALSPRVTVVPPWVDSKEVARPAGGHLLVLEPGRAFGTGLHATTSLVAEVLDARADALRGREILDVGTGSGILALVALLLGASRAIAIDVDPDVIDVVRENAERNALADRVDVREATVDRVDGTFPFVLANIEAKVLDPIAPALVKKVESRGLLVLSGILAREQAAIDARYAALGLSLVGSSRRGEHGEPRDEDWICSTFVRP